MVTTGKTSLSMEVNIMSWNMRDSDLVEKLHSVRRLVRKFRPGIMGLQETKRSI